MSTTLTFDDLPSSASAQPVPNGYDGYNFTSLSYGTPAQVTYTGPGNANAVVSSPNVAFHSGPNTNISRNDGYVFSLSSADITDSSGRNSTVTLTGYSGTTQVASIVVPITTTSATHVTFDSTFSNLTKLSLFAGAPTIDYDNIVLDAVPAVATHFSIAGPTNDPAGNANTYTVTALSDANVVATQYTGTVHFSSTDAQATLPADLTLVNGVATINATFKTAGAQSLTATDTADPAVSGTQAGIAVFPIGATHFTVGGVAPSSAAGTDQTTTVTALDPYGNVDTGYSGTVHFTSSDAQASLPADFTLTSGVGTAHVTLGTAGSQSLTAVDTADPALSGTVSGAIVTPGAASHFAVSGLTPNVAGTAETASVTALDAYGNVATGYAGTVHFTSSDAQAVLPADATLTNGVGSFPVTLRSSGTQSLTATDTVSALITGSEPVAISAAPASGGGGVTAPAPTGATPGSDVLVGATGSDTIAGQAGDDTIQGGSGNSLLLGNQGNDVITTGDGQNTVYGGLDNDRITAGNGGNLLYGNEGADSIIAGNGNNTIWGGSGNSSIDSADGSDVITVGTGNDLIFGNGGDDTVGAGAGSDSVVGGFGRDMILGNQGNDVLLGNQGNDTLYGGQGGDTVVGGQGDDVLYGNQGDDVLYGNEGLNTFVFASGDTDFRSGQSTGDTVVDFTTGTSRIDFATGPAGTATNFGATSTTSTDFASIQAAAQALINGGDTYAFVADGVDGFLFTTGGTGTAITDAVKLAGAGSVGAVKYTDIAHGALA